MALSRLEQAKLIQKKAEAPVRHELHIDVYDLDKNIKKLQATLENGLTVSNLSEIAPETLKDDIQQLSELVANLTKSIKAGVKITNLDEVPVAKQVEVKNQPTEMSIKNVKALTKPVTKAGDIYAEYAFANKINENGIYYFGFLAASGAWFIQRIASTPNGNEQRSLYAAGTKDYETNWNNRAKLNYVPRNEVNING